MNMTKKFYGEAFLNPATLVNIASSHETWQEILSFHRQLATDDYVKYLDRWYNKCINLYGKNWFYLDIINVLYSASKVLKPKNYLEIGVRRGRSACTVVRGCPSVDICAFDMWVSNYANMDNPGSNFVQQELSRHEHCGKVHFINGNSHETLPSFFNTNSDLKFDLITVDGDHSAEGATKDLEDVIPYLSVGGVLVFDDISHPQHRYLLDVWKSVISKHNNLTDYCFTEIGYGVAFAIKT
jgi:predicted O-methyltransferase YrrM